jgi:hypothetical protein
MNIFLKNRLVQFSALLVAVVIGVLLLNPMTAEQGPNRAKVASLSEELHAACQAGSVEPTVRLMHNNVLFEQLSIDDFIQKHADVDLSIPYDKPRKGRMYPVIEFFKLKPNIEYVQLLTCANNREIMLTQADLLTRPDPLYWMSKRKGFMSVHSMVYDKKLDKSEKTKFRARPILIINLIDITNH